MNFPGKFPDLVKFPVNNGEISGFRVRKEITVFHDTFGNLVRYHEKRSEGVIAPERLASVATDSLAFEITQSETRFVELGLLADVACTAAEDEHHLAERFDCFASGIATRIANTLDSLDTIDKEIFERSFPDSVSYQDVLDICGKNIAKLLETMEIWTVTNEEIAINQKIRNEMTFNGLFRLSLDDGLNKDLNTSFRRYSSVKNLLNTNVFIYHLKFYTERLQEEWTAFRVQKKTCDIQQNALNSNPYLAKMGLTVVKHFQNGNELSTSIAVRELNGQKEVYFLSKGTKYMQDHLVDPILLHTTLKKYKIYKCAGCYNNHRCIFDDILEVVSHFGKHHPTASFYIVGSGSGGTLSIMIGKALWGLSRKQIKPKIFCVAAPVPYQYEHFTKKGRNFICHTTSDNIIFVSISVTTVPYFQQLAGPETIGLHIYLPQGFWSPLDTANLPLTGLDSVANYLQDFSLLHCSLFKDALQGYKQIVKPASQDLPLLIEEFENLKNELGQLKENMYEPLVRGSGLGEIDVVDYFRDDDNLVKSSNACILDEDHLGLIGNSKDFAHQYLKFLDQFREFENKLEELKRKIPTVIAVCEQVTAFYERLDTRGNYLRKGIGAITIVGSTAFAAGGIVTGAVTGTVSTAFNYLSGTTPQ